MQTRPFKLQADYQPAGDQPGAIEKLTQGLQDNKKLQILLGVTGSGKTFTIANVIANLNRPTLVIAHNKTLAAQLCSEFRQFFPENAVEYFVSYYDYYQPEAYLPARDMYIEKEADINKEIERLRHSATRSLMTRRDVIIVASVSCIYGLGAPEDYVRGVIPLACGTLYNRKSLLMDLQRAQYSRNDVELYRGRYRVKGDIIDVYPAYEDIILRLDFFGDELENMYSIHPVTGEILETHSQIELFPATHYVVNDALTHAISAIQNELNDHLLQLRAQNKELEAKRIEQRTKYDIEMMMEMGYCKGIENYSRHLMGRGPGSAPGVLMDFFPDDYLTVIDESHATLPQIRGMQHGDFSRKKTLVDYGFRLPSAIDNRPLTFSEFEERCHQTICVSATPGHYELEICKSDDPTLGHPLSMWRGYDLVEQIIRPTGLLDPKIEIRKTQGQIDDLITECQTRIQKNERVLITAVTKKLSEELSTYLEQKGIKVRYLHSDIDAIARIDILHDLRLGVFDVLVGVNLLREGLDLPEVSLVAILDADKEGFLRNERSLIQTMGRAARNAEGTVILYADQTTDSMHRAINETRRRREIQAAHNTAHGITPKTIIKKVADIRDEERALVKEMTQKAAQASPDELPHIIESLQEQMLAAASRLEFELAAVLRDQIEKIRSASEPLTDKY